MTKKKKKIQENAILDKPTVKVGDYIKVADYPNAPRATLKVTKLFHGFPEETYGKCSIIPGLASTVKKLYSKHDQTGWWIETNGKYLFPNFGVEVTTAPDLSEAIEDGFGKSNVAPVKLGDEVVNINVNKPKPTKVLDIAYGSIDKLKADEKIDNDKMKQLFGDAGTKMWWIVVKNGKGKTMAVPYGHDGFMKVSDAKEYLNESKSLLKDTEDETETTEKEPVDKKEPVETVNESAFSKQHYIAMANILKMSKTKDEIVNKLVEFFKKDNPLFNTQKFVAFVGVEQKPTTPQESEETDDEEPLED